MSHPYARREESRQSIARLFDHIDMLKRRAHREAEREAVAFIMDRRMREAGHWKSDCCVGLGKSGQTKELVQLHAEYKARRLAALEPEIAFVLRKIERTIRFYGFNDISLEGGRHEHVF